MGRSLRAFILGVVLPMLLIGIVLTMLGVSETLGQILQLLLTIPFIFTLWPRLERRFTRLDGDGE